MALALLLPLADAVEVGGYLSYWKAIPVLILLLVWLRMLTWIDKDAEAAYLPREPINGGFIGGVVLACVLFFFIPNFWIAFGVFFVLFATEIGIYLGIRNSKVGLADLWKSIGESLRPKKKAKDYQATGGEVALIGKGGGVVTPPPAETPELAGYIALQQLLGDPLVRGAERIDMAPADGAAQVRYQVDGVPYNANTIALDASQAAVTYVKGLAGLDLNEKRKPQKGKMKASLAGARHELEINTAGSASGEFLKILVDPKKRHALRMEELGFGEDQMAKMQELIGEPGGIVLVSAPKGQGLTTAMYGIMRAHDAFLTHIHTVERAPEEDLEGITQNPIPANATPDEEFKALSWVISQEPEMIIITFLEKNVRVLIATRSQPFSSTRLMISLTGSP